MRWPSERISPALVIVLAGLWLLLNQSLSVAQLLLGVVLAVVLARAAATLRPLQARLRRLDIAALLVLVVLKDIVLNNISVARIVLGLAPPIRSGFLSIPLDLRDPHGLAALAAIVTATPGTVWSGLSPTGDALTLHVLDLGDEARLIRVIKHRYEQPLMRIFE
jgi:multicomponent K+:H+ antiporter subunit E